MLKTFKFKLYSGNSNQIDHHINIACFIYNHCISLKKRFYRRFKKSLSKNDLQKHLTKLKKLKKFSFFKELGSQVIQDITDRIEKGYQAFFKHDNKKCPDKKKLVQYKSITYKQAGYKKLEDNKIEVQGVIYKYFDSRPIEGIIKNVILKRDSVNNHYVCFVCETVGKVKKLIQSTGNKCGVDSGLKTFLTFSDGRVVESPQYLKQSLKAIKKAHQSLSRKVKGSNHRRKARLVLARAYEKINDQRKDWCYKVSLDLVKKYDELYFEDLNLKGMQKLWGRKVSDIAFGDFLKILEYVFISNEKKITKIDRYFASSQICNECKYQYKELKLSEREWKCPQCGHFHDRSLPFCLCKLFLPSYQ